MPFSKIVKVLLKLGNNVHVFHKFAPFLEYLEIKRGPPVHSKSCIVMKASDVLGLEITEDSIVLDVKSQQKMERKVRRHLATQSSIIEADVNQKSSGKWTEQCILASDKLPYRITVGLMRQRESKFSQLKELLLKIPPLKRATDGELQATYPPSSHVHGKPEERYPVLKDPTHSLSSDRTASLFRSVNNTSTAE